MKSAKYLDDLIRVRGLKDDAGLCRHVGWSHGVVHNYRSDIRSMDNERCLQVARELGIKNPLPIIMAADLDRAKRAGWRSLWEVFSPRMAHSDLVALLAPIGLGVANFVTPLPAKAVPLSHPPATSTLCYIKSRGRLWTRLQQALRVIRARAEPAPA